jgi:hypothetical protein
MVVSLAVNIGRLPGASMRGGRYAKFTAKSEFDTCISKCPTGSRPQIRSFGSRLQNWLFGDIIGRYS